MYYANVTLNSNVQSSLIIKTYLNSLHSIIIRIHSESLRNLLWPVVHFNHINSIFLNSIISLQRVIPSSEPDVWPSPVNQSISSYQICRISHTSPFQMDITAVTHTTLLSTLSSTWIWQVVMNDWISIDLPRFVTLTIGQYALRQTTNFVISGNIGYFHSIDLPKMTTFTIKQEALYNSNLQLTSKSIVSQPIRSSWIQESQFTKL